MNELIVLSKVDEVYLQVNYSDIGTGLELKEYLSCFASNYKYNPKYKAKMWNGKITFYDHNRRLLPIGLLPKFVKFCREFRYDFEFDFDISSFKTDISMEQIQEFADFLFRGLDITLRDYQLESVYRSIANKRGVVLSSVGSGKSAVIYSVIRFLQAADKKIILIVPNVSLVEQMYSDFKEYGWNNLYSFVSKLHAQSKANFSSDVLITTWQSIVKKGSTFFEEYDAVICDECHLSKSFSINHIAKQCVNAEYRIGFTGTLPKEPCDVNNIHGYLGPVIFRLESNELIQRGILSKIKIANLLLKYPDSVCERNIKRPYAEEIGTIVDFDRRNKGIDFVFENVKNGQNVLILCRLIRHLEKIKKHLECKFPDRKIEVIHGDIKASERERIRNEMETMSNVILLGSFATMSTGINIKRIHHVVFASSYKSEIKVLQSIGRGLRTHQTKDVLILWDLVDDLRAIGPRGGKYENHVYGHWLERLEYYEQQKFEYHTKTIKI